MAAFKNRLAAKKIAEAPCEFCGTLHFPRDAAHIIDEKISHGDGSWNALSLCPNCHKIFDERLRPKLYRALEKWGTNNLPESWKKSNKLARQPNDATPVTSVAGQQDE